MGVVKQTQALQAFCWVDVGGTDPAGVSPETWVLAQTISSYAPAVGDWVALLENQGDYIVLGALGLQPPSLTQTGTGTIVISSASFGLATVFFAVPFPYVPIVVVGGSTTNSGGLAFFYGLDANSNGGQSLVDRFVVRASFTSLGVGSGTARYFWIATGSRP